jgi:hypothetical protein
VVITRMAIDRQRLLIQLECTPRWLVSRVAMLLARRESDRCGSIRAS